MRGQRQGGIRGGVAVSVRALHGSLQDRIPDLIAEGVRVDAVVCDPPYELTAKRPGGRSEATRGAVMGGFMGMKWDGSGVAFDPSAWSLCLEVMKPGAHLVAFGGTRTHHRVMCAIEDAGFEIRDVLMWIYGSGFPKSKNHPDEFPGLGTALKPAWEPIILARKPLAGTVAENMRAHGVGMLDIDGCRIETGDALTGSNGPPFKFGGHNHRPFHDRVGEASAARRYAEAGGTNFAATPSPRGGDPKGRWPANVVHDGSDEVLACFPNAPGQQCAVGPEHGAKTSVNTFGDYGPRDTFKPRGDSGSAARFFFCAKASRKDRNEGCEHLQGKPLNWSSGDQSPGTFQSEGTDRTSPNHHPTVKPTALMRWLVRMVTPRGGVVLDPFAGSGSTGKAAVLEGRDVILIEREDEYMPILRARLAWAEAERARLTSQGSLLAEVS